jgi:hypothetical protein
MSDTAQNPIEPSLERVQDDVWAVVGGNFTSDALGSDIYNAIRARIQASPERYLQVFETLFMGASFDPRLQSKLHAPALFRLTLAAAPSPTRDVAGRLANKYREALDSSGYSDPVHRIERFSPSEDPQANQARRLHARVVELEREVLDRPAR